jgi:NADH:ubiquinone oxidoreductase subunit 2 (subunit N)
LIFHLTIWFCILSAITTVISFFLYLKARMTLREERPGDTPDEHTRKLAVLDRRERQYQRLHFISLFIFVVLGVLILVHLANVLNTPTTI